MKLNRILIQITAALLVPVAVIMFSVRSKSVAAERTGMPNVRIGIFMYHSILNSESKCGKYVITPAQLEADLKYLKDRGYQTVIVEDLIRYVEEGEALPEKPVVLTFDDGYYNNYSYLYPLLEKYDMKAVISVLGRYADEYSASNEKPNNNYSHATWTMLKEMKDSGRVEILNHSYDMHSADSRLGLKKKQGESEEHFKQAVVKDITKLQARFAEHLNLECRAFTYPFGFENETTEGIMKGLGMKATLSCYEGINELTQGDRECLYSLKRYNRPWGKSAADYFKKLDY